MELRPLLVAHCECEIGKTPEPMTVPMTPQNVPVEPGGCCEFMCPKCQRRITVFNMGLESPPPTDRLGPPVPVQ